MKNIITKNSLDLFSFPIVRFLLKNKAFLLTLRLIVAFLFFYAISLGFFYPTKEENIFTTALLWSLFWPFFIVLTLSTFGRVFCGICPHAFIGKYITKFGLKKRMPKSLANPFIGLTILITGYWLIIFIFNGSYTIPYNASVLFFVLTLSSFLFYFLFKDMAYCKFICPIGTVTKVFSKICFTKLETYNEGCSKCKTFDCAEACTYDLKPFTFQKKNSMEDCTLCMDCAISCDNVAFHLKKPSSLLFRNFKVQKVEVWAVLFLTAILSFGMIFHHALNRTAIADQFIWNKISNYLHNFINPNLLNIEGLSVFAFSICFIFTLYIAGIFIASKIMNIDFQKTFYTLGYAMIPLFIIGGTPHILEFFFLRNASNIVNGFNQAFALGFAEMQPLATRKDSWIHIFKILTHIAYIWAFVLMTARMKLLEAKKNLKIIAYPFASIVIIAYLGLNFYTGYVFQTYGVKENPNHQAASQVKAESK